MSVAELELRNGQYSNAAEHFSKAITMGEKSVSVYYNRVLALMLSKELGSAKEAIKQALKEYPADQRLNSLLEQLIKITIVG